MNLRILPIVAASIVIAACNSDSSGSNVDKRKDEEPVTRSFAVTDFTGVAINGSFASTIRQGSDFTVELTVDADVVGLLDVYVDGTILRIGFVPNSDIRASTLEAVVTMPTLETIALNGSNQVELWDFSGSTIDADLQGNNFLNVQNVAYDFMTARVNGSVLFEFINVAALPAGHIDISGSSTATLNLMDFATLTGSVSGTSTLNYYGSHINLDLDTAPTATVVRLGASR